MLLPPEVFILSPGKTRPLPLPGRQTHANHYHYKSSKSSSHPNRSYIDCGFFATGVAARAMGVAAISSSNIASKDLICFTGVSRILAASPGEGDAPLTPRGRTALSGTIAGFCFEGFLTIKGEEGGTLSRSGADVRVAEAEGLTGVSSMAEEGIRSRKSLTLLLGAVPGTTDALEGGKPEPLGLLVLLWASSAKASRKRLFAGVALTWTD